jgi:hypothetical protein
MVTGGRWKRRPPGSNWGEFGPEDELGRLNLLTPQKVLQGIAEVKLGRSFCLSLPLNYPGGMVLNANRHPPRLTPVKLRNGEDALHYRLSGDDPNATDVFCDDEVSLALQYSTHWDALSHVGQEFDADGDGTAEAVYYNGFRAGSDKSGGNEHHGARRLGVEKMAEACLQGRAVMIDLEAHFGGTGQMVGYEALQTIFEADNIVVEPGDLVCLRTGFDRMLLSMKGAPDKARLMAGAPALDGRDEDLLEWITRLQIVALISDNYAVEALPAAASIHGLRCSTLPLHEHCLFRLGVYLGELWYLSELADWLRAHGRSRFLLTGPPMRLPGAVAAPAVPVATV